jgi:hypothetical protein
MEASIQQAPSVGCCCSAVAEIELAFRMYIYKNGEKEKLVSWTGSRAARNIEIQKKRRRRRATRSFAV